MITELARNFSEALREINHKKEIEEAIKKLSLTDNE